MQPGQLLDHRDKSKENIKQQFLKVRLALFKSLAYPCLIKSCGKSFIILIITCCAIQILQACHTHKHTQCVEQLPSYTKVRSVTFFLLLGFCDSDNACCWISALRKGYRCSISFKTWPLSCLVNVFARFFCS